MRIVLLCIACLPLLAAADDDERARIAAERQALLQRFAQEEADCQRRFAVTDCVLDVRDRRRAALAPLRARELQLDEAERQRRAAERKAAIEARQRAQAARPPPPPQAPERAPREPAAPAAPESRASSPSPSASASVSASAPASASASASPPTAAPAAPRRKASDAESRAAAAAERERAAQRRREAFEANQERIRRRLAEREAAGKVVDPLPVPGSSPAR